VTVLAISEDSPADSAAFAKDYGIQFPLLSDEAGRIARLYAGMSSDHNALPGITIIDASGRIAFRQIASTKDDRMTAAELISTLDRTLGTRGGAVADDGYAANERTQLRLDAGGGVIGGLGTASASLTGLFPLGRYLVVGPRIATEPRAAPLSLDVAAMLRAPIWANAGAIELGAIGGWSPWGTAGGGEVGALADLWFAWSPTWAIQLGVAYTAHHLGEDGVVHQLVGTLGVGRLFRL